MNMELCGNGKLVMVMNVFFVFLLMFVGTLEDHNKYPNLPKPYHFNIIEYPCPNCASWCKYDPIYTCDYSCDQDVYYDIDSKFDNVTIEKHLSWLDRYYYKNGRENILHKYSRFFINNNFAVRGTPEIEKNIKEVCADKETYNCTFGTLGYYPICTLDWKPYDNGLGECCKLLKKCMQSKDPSIEEGCVSSRDSYWVYKYIGKSAVTIAPREDPKYRAIISFIYHRTIYNLCHLQCTNGRLVPNNRSQTTQQTTLTPTINPQTTEKTTFPTSISTTKLTTTTIPIPKTPPTSNLTAKVDKTEALSQVIVGFLGINFVIVGAAIVAVIAELV